MRLKFRKKEEQVVDFDAQYTYKGNRYQILIETYFKFGDVWIPAIEYLCLYENPKGMIWVRTREEFFRLFKKVE